MPAPHNPAAEHQPADLAEWLRSHVQSDGWTLIAMAPQGAVYAKPASADDPAARPRLWIRVELRALYDGTPCPYSELTLREFAPDVRRVRRIAGLGYWASNLKGAGIPFACPSPWEPIEPESAMAEALRYARSDPAWRALP